MENGTKHEKEEPSGTLKKPTEKTNEELRLEIEVRKVTKSKSSKIISKY